MNPICEGFQKGQNQPCIHSIGDKFDFCALPEIFRCSEYLRRNELTLSYSTIRNSICKRKLYWSYIAGIQLIIKPLPMRLGEIAGEFLNDFHSQPTEKPPNGYKWCKYGNHWHILGASYNCKEGIKLDDLKDSEGNLPYQIMAMLGLFKGYKEKEFNSMKGIVQARFEWFEEGYPHIIGYMDLKTYDKIGYEFKYSSRPDAYKEKFIIQDQVATYFLGNPTLKRITVRAIQVPQLKLAKNEGLEDYRDRVYQDFLNRPLHYINDTSFWRNEFNYDEIREKYKMIANEIQRFIEMGGMKYFYQSNGPNTCFGETMGTAVSNCEYLQICESGVVSDQLYKRREIKYGDKNSNP